MTTPTDRVRAAITNAIEYIHDNGGNTDGLTDALHEFIGMVLVPVEPTQERLDKMAKFAIAARLSSEYTWRDYVRDLHGIVIAPYVEGE